MPNNKKSTAWNTEEDDAWLAPRLPEYKASKNNKILRDAFTKALRRDWLELHPVGEPPQELIESHKIRPLTKSQEKQHSIAVAQAKIRGDNPPELVLEVVDEVKAKVFAKEEMEDKVVTKLLVWYNNHTRNPKGQKGKNGSMGASFLNLNPSSVKMASPVQAYYALNRATFKDKIADAWLEFKKASGGNLKVTWITFWNNWLKESLEKEPKAVKDEVDAFRKTYSEHSDPAEPLDERNERYVVGVHKLPRTIRGAAQMIKTQTGWSTIIITGGPHPAYEGDLQMLLAAEGTGTAGQTFEDWLGVKRRKKLSTWFSDFLAETYGGPEELEKWALVDDDPKDNEEDGSGSESSSSSSESEDSEPETKEPKKTQDPKGKTTKDVKGQGGKGHEEGLKNDGGKGKEKVGSKKGDDGQRIEGDKADPIDIDNNDNNDKPKEKGTKAKPRARVSADGTKGSLAKDEMLQKPQPFKPAKSAHAAKDQAGTEGEDVEMGPLDTEPPVDEGTPSPAEEDLLIGVEPVAGMEATWGNLKGASSDRRWQKLLRDFMMYESAGPAAGNLSTTKRPKAISDWIQSKKKAVIPSLPASYPDQWAAWWDALQPKWRVGADGLLSKIVGEDAEWSSLHKGGKSGFYTIVVSLGWIVHTFPIAARVWELVEDVTWVLSELRLLPTTSGAASSSSRKKDAIPEPTFIGSSRKRTLSEKASAAEDSRASKRSKEAKAPKKKAKGGHK